MTLNPTRAQAKLKREAEKVIRTIQHVVENSVTKPIKKSKNFVKVEENTLEFKQKSVNIQEKNKN